MPADSLHPDAQLTHQVLVERWLTDQEYAELEKQRKLGWQVTVEQEREQEQERKEREAKGDVSMQDGTEVSRGAARRVEDFTELMAVKRVPARPRR